MWYMQGEYRVDRLFLFPTCRLSSCAGCLCFFDVVSLSHRLSGALLCVTCGRSSTYLQGVYSPSSVIFVYLRYIYNIYLRGKLMAGQRMINTPLYGVIYLSLTAILTPKIGGPPFRPR
jgi:hypothetical protein